MNHVTAMNNPKQSHLFSYVLLLLLLMGCKPKADTFVLSASGLPETLNGKQAYVLDTDKKVIGIAEIEGGGFEIMSDPDPTALCMLALGDESNIVVDEFVKEGVGELYSKKITPTLMEPNKDTIYGITWEARSTDLNTDLLSFRSDLDDQVAPLEDKVNELSYDRLWKKEDRKAVDSLTTLIDRYDEQARLIKEEITTAYARKHQNDAVGIAVFNEIGYRGEADFVRKYEAASDAVQKDPKLNRIYTQNLVIVETSAGHPYKDFTMDDGEGTTAKLSDYMDQGQYLLVDFWASWCGPCRKGIPLLAKLYEKYNAKGLRVLSIGVSEENKAVNEKVAKESGIIWDHFYDASSESADTYGVVTIPVVLLISPDGTILLRDSHADAVDEILQKELSNK